MGSNINSSEYALARLNDQKAWYSKKASANKKAYLTCKLIALIGASTVTVIAAFGSLPTWVSAVLGAIVVISSGIEGIYSFHSIWVTYRLMAERLESESTFYHAKAGPYKSLNSEDSLSLLVERVEGMMDQEHLGWSALMQGRHKTKPDDPTDKP